MNKAIHSREDFIKYLKTLADKYALKIADEYQAASLREDLYFPIKTCEENNIDVIGCYKNEVSVYGYYYDKVISYSLDPLTGSETINKIMSYLRENNLASLSSYKIYP